MADHCIAFSNICRQLIELGTVKIFAGSLIQELIVKLETLELPQLLLIELTDTQIPDELTRSALPFCRFWI